MNWKNYIRAQDVVKLMENWNEQLPLKGTEQEKDFFPVVRLYDPFSNAQWLVTEADEDGLAFGLAHILEWELGYFDLGEIFDMKIVGIRRMQQDLTFNPDRPLSQYAAEAF